MSAEIVGNLTCTKDALIHQKEQLEIYKEVKETETIVEDDPLEQSNKDDSIQKTLPRSLQRLDIMFEAGPNQYLPIYPAEVSLTTSSSEQRVQLSPQEEALQSLCKHLLRSRIFRGYYLERRFVQPLESYRDVISLQRTERELEKILLDVSRRIQLFYAHSNSTNIWIGVTHGPMIGTAIPNGSLETYIWVELDELAFGQYWFSIKSIRFRQNEIILKLKMIREVEDEVLSFTPMKQRNYSPKPIGASSTSEINEKLEVYEITPKSTPVTETFEKQIDFEDFIAVVRQWGTSIKHSVYEFMSQDINKENMKGVLRFLALLIFTLMCFAVHGIKFLGIFTLRFMYEFCRLTYVMTPIILKIIEVFNKIVGGFYILLAMIWRDTFGKKANAPPPARRNFHQLQYDRPLYQAIKYDVQKSHKRKVL